MNCAVAQVSFLTYIPGKRMVSGWMSSVEMQRLLDVTYVVVPKETRNGVPTKQAHSAIRLSIIKQVLAKSEKWKANGETGNVLTFISQPYIKDTNFAVTVRSGTIIASDIAMRDDLDIIIDNAFLKNKGEVDMIFSKTDLKALKPIYLWKSSDELASLGYWLISSRYRTNTDPAYRRHNIVTAFAYLGHVRVLNPGDSFPYLGSIHYDPKAMKNYKNGLAIVDDDEIPVYGWGICWGSTAAYQGRVTNIGLKLDARNHSKRFSNLYTATINGVKIVTPGIDATVFAGAVDLKVTNVSDHPIIVVLNYNGNYNGVEETLSLWLPKDKGSLEFVSKKTSSQKKNKTNPKTGSGYTETVKTGCYTRNINWKNKTSCYREIY